MNMVAYTFEQRWKILRHYIENHGNVAERMRKLCTDFGRREAQSAPYVCYLVEKGKETGIFIDKPKREKPKAVRIILLLREAPSSSQRPFTTIEHFTDITETNFL